MPQLTVAAIPALEGVKAKVLLSLFRIINVISHFKTTQLPMTSQSIIDIVAEKLRKYPDINFDKRSESELLIHPRNDKGFAICIQTNDSENTLHFGTYHWHFDNTEEDKNEMLDQLIFGLTGIARLKEFSKNGNSYKLTLQLQCNPPSFRTANIYTK